MSDLLLRMVEYYSKFAQEPPPVINTPAAKQTATMNHAIRLDQQTRILDSAVIAGIRAGSTRPEARTHADTLRNLAIKYRVELQGNNYTNLQSMVNTMISNYDVLEDRYIGYEYEPMKKIKESLLYLKTYPPVAPPTETITTTT